MLFLLLGVFVLSGGVGGGEGGGLSLIFVYAHSTGTVISGRWSKES